MYFVSDTLGGTLYAVPSNESMCRAAHAASWRLFRKECFGNRSMHWYERQPTLSARTFVLWRGGNIMSTNAVVCSSGRHTTTEFSIYFETRHPFHSSRAAKHSSGCHSIRQEVRRAIVLLRSHTAASRWKRVRKRCVAYRNGCMHGKNWQFHLMCMVSTERWRRIDRFSMCQRGDVPHRWCVEH